MNYSSQYKIAANRENLKMKKVKTLILLLFAIFSCVHVYAQESRIEAGVRFRKSQSVIDENFADNAEQLQQILSLLDSLNQDPTITIRSVEFCGAVSPEGPTYINRRLSNARLEALESYVMSRLKLDIPDSLILHNDHYIPWDKLAQEVAKSDVEYKDEVLKIITRKNVEDVLDEQGYHIDGRLPLLHDIDDGKVWTDMYNRFFAPMRNAYMVMVTYTRYPEVTRGDVALEERLGFPCEELKAEYPAPDGPEPRHLYLKTNAIGWGLAVINLAAEIDLGRKWSFQLPIYYSGHNYFTSTIKFRTFTIQPEIRYWFSGNAKDKFFVGAHFGMSYYNFAVDGNYRIQDKDGDTPALGGGISLGYRMPISKNGRWKMEFSVGGGVYSLEYDKFHNTDKTSAGALSHTIDKKTWFGLDHAAVSFAYMFNLKRKHK